MQDAGGNEYPPNERATYTHKMGLQFLLRVDVKSTAVYRDLRVCRGGGSGASVAVASNPDKESRLWKLGSLVIRLGLPTLVVLGPGPEVRFPIVPRVLGSGLGLGRWGLSLDSG